MTTLAMKIKETYVSLFTFLSVALLSHTEVETCCPSCFYLPIKLVVENPWAMEVLVSGYVWQFSFHLFQSVFRYRYEECWQAEFFQFFKKYVLQSGQDAVSEAEAGKLGREITNRWQQLTLGFHCAS